MTLEQHNTGRQREREKALFLYNMALQRSDFDTVERVLQQAEVDPELERMIMELNAEYRVERDATVAVGTETANLVRRLLHEHLPSGFGTNEEVSPLTVGEVAARLEADQRVAASDKGALQRLRGNQQVLPAQITARTLSSLAHELGIAASERFWRAFQQAAIALGLARSQSEMRLAATREQQRHGRQGDTSHTQRPTDEGVD